jgi:aminoglycoside 6'-N-acetyltransferase I
MASRSTSVREFEAADWQEWQRMRCALWPDASAAEHAADMDAWLLRSDTVVVVCARASGGLCGFAEAGSRLYADGCRTSPVAFLEGWYVDAGSRRSGIGRALLEAVEAWARARGFQELASDALLDNHPSHRAHEHLGFIEVERAVRYRKSLASGAEREPE